MRLFLLTCAAASLAVVSLAQPAFAQWVSRGSYQNTCRRIHISGEMLSADCADGNGHYRASTIHFSRCVGDIGNRNGMLNCSGAMGKPGR